MHISEIFKSYFTSSKSIRTNTFMNFLVHQLTNTGLNDNAIVLLIIDL